VTLLLQLTFKGARFDGGHLDLDALGELVAYKNAIARMAEALYRKEYGRSPKGMRKGLRLALIGKIEPGSAVATVAQVGQLPLEGVDAIVTKAQAKVDSVLRKAEQGRPFDTDDILALSYLQNVGASLRPDEALLVARANAPEAAVTVSRDSVGVIRSKLADLKKPRHVDEVGKIVAIDKNRHTFALRTTRNHRIDGKYKPTDLELEKALASAVGGGPGYVMVSGTRMTSITGDTTRDWMSATGVRHLPHPKPDFEAKMASLFSSDEVDPELARRSMEAIRRLVWGKGFLPPVVYLSDDGGFTAEWSLPGPWELSVDFNRETIIADASNPVTDESEYFEVLWSDLGGLEEKVDVLFRRAGWTRQ
jgi:hypothetical protein